MDEEKILRERIYDLQKIYASIDDIFVNKCDLVKSENGFYLEHGTSSDFANFGNAMGMLRNKKWFLENVKTWLMFDNADNNDPEDVVIDDIKEFYYKKYRIGA
jgi:hypothetical protein